MSDADVHATKLTGYGVVRILLGVVLLTAVGLKRSHLAAEPVLKTGVPKPRRLLLGVTEFEFFSPMRPVAGVGRESPSAAMFLETVCFSGVSLANPLS